LPELNEDVPVFDCLVRSEYLYDLTSHHGEYESGTVFGIASLKGRALGFHFLTDRGAQLARLPISALTFKEHDPHLPLHYLELWDCFSYEVAVTDFDWLHELPVKVIIRDKQVFDGTYLFTVDWYGCPEAENPGADGHKNAHIIQLECGCMAAQPNHRIIWSEPSMIVNPYRIEKGDRPDYLINTHTWKCEIDSRWTAEDSYKMFYDDNDLEGEDISQADKVELSRLRALKDVNHPKYEEELEKWEKSKLASGQAAEKKPSREP